jgi:hypothetical protein
MIRSSPAYSQKKRTKKITLKNFNIFVRIKLNPLEWVLVTYIVT